jgi:hypothetical protein
MINNDRVFMGVSLLSWNDFVQDRGHHALKLSGAACRAGPTQLVSIRFPSQNDACLLLQQPTMKNQDKI